MKSKAIAFARPRLLRPYCIAFLSNAMEGLLMPRNFYFGKDADIVAGSANFASLIATGFASYGLTTGQATAFGTLNTALQSAQSAAVNPPTRTPVAIEARNVALRNMRASAINLAKIVYSTAT